MKLTRLKTEGLKGHDLDIQPGNVLLVTGENGAGKSSALVAIYLLVHGRTSAPDTQTTALDSGVKVAATGDGVMSLARGDALQLTGEWQHADGRRLRVVRSWKRGKDGKVTEKLDLSGFAVNDGGKAQKAAMVRSVLGPSVDLFFPADLLALSPAKLRDRLLSAVPDSAFGAGPKGGDLRPTDAPWLPAYDPEEGSALAWLTRARGLAAEKLKGERAELRQSQAAVAEYEDAWGDVQSSDTLREKLSRCRAELAQVDESDRAAKDLATLRAELQAAREAPSVSEADAVVAEAEASLEEAKAQEARLAEARQAYSRAHDEAVRLGRALKEQGWPDEPVEADVTPAEYEERLSKAKELEEAHRKAGNTMSEAITRYNVIQSGGGLDACPKCGEDLRSALEAAIDLAHEAKEQATEAVYAVERDLEAARARVASSERALKVKALRADHEAAVASKREAERQIAGIGEPDLREARARAADALEAMARVRVAAEGLADLEMRLEFAEDEQVERVGKRKREAIEADIADAEAALEEMGAYNARKAARAEAEESVEICERRVETLKAVVAQLDTSCSAMLGAAAGWIERRMESACGRPVRVVLTDERGNETCRLEVGGVSVSALSGAEMVRFLAGLVVTLAEASGAAWRPLLLDRVESVSQANREGFLRDVVKAQRAGAITQAILTGCPDAVPEVEGVTVLRLGDAQEAAA